GQSEVGGRMDVGRARRLLDDFGAGVLDARARQDAEARSDLLDACLRQAAEEVFRRHIADMDVGAERIARDARDEPAVALPERAGEDGRERLARDDAQAFGVVREQAALGDQLQELGPGRTGWIVGLDRYVAGVESKDEQADQGHVVAGVDLEALDQRVGAIRADDLGPLVGDLGAGLLGRGRGVLDAGGTTFVLPGLRLGYTEDDFVDRAIARVDRKADLVALLRLRPGAI